MRTCCMRTTLLVAVISLSPMMAGCQSAKPDCAMTTQLTDHAVTFPGKDYPVQLVRVAPSPGAVIVNLTSPDLSQTYRDFSDDKKRAEGVLLLQDGVYVFHGVMPGHRICETQFMVG